jgi:hypothetical protein
MIKPPITLFGQQATLKVFAGNNAYGEKVYGVINTLDPSIVVSYNNSTGEYIIKCRFEPTISTARNPQQEQKTFVGSIFTLGTDIPTQSTIIFEGNKYIVADCVKHYSTIGISYLEVLLQ